MRKIACLVVLTCFLVTLSGTAFAWSDRSAGRPYQSFLAPPSLAIWHERNDEFHVKSANLRGQHVFSGEIRTDGRFYDINEKSMGNGDFIKLDRNRKSIRFRLTGRGFDEFSFKVRKGDTLKFDLKRDGRDLPNQQILIGKKGWHPRDNRFTLK
ncbi:hypothetical protein M7775_09605 [Sporomusa sphaeroides DSM 2875]|uniref:hypothetical protein n=1 Tax=Sporomusa sphaeroides TaxID=47679 RepID=UPI002030A367|nr:hypothetical protein [Sporomusa sphaeroides]MCM0758819.1 hypothetical protein [Sporomusa sphaeroides DSM 2875]